MVIAAETTISQDLSKLWWQDGYTSDTCAGAVTDERREQGAGWTHGLASLPALNSRVYATAAAKVA
jgi:hypothetical protein